MKFVWIIIVSLLFFSCSRKKVQYTIENQDNFIFVNIADDFNHERNLKISDIASDIEYIQLETSDKSIMSNIVKVLVTSEHVFCSDSQKNLMMFLRNGSFLHKIANRGQGPNDYYDLLDFTVDTVYQKIYIADYAQRIREYNFEGKFSKDIKLNMQMSRIELLETGKLVCYIPEELYAADSIKYNICIIDTNGVVINKHIARLQRNGNNLIGSHFAIFYQRPEGSLAFIEALNDSLYSFTNQNDYIAYGCLNKGIHKINPELTFEQVAFESSHNMRINKFIETPFGMFIRYACNCRGINKSHWSYFDKSEHRFFQLPEEKAINNDLDGGFNIFPICWTNNYLIGYIESMDFLHDVDFSKVTKERQISLKQFTEKLKNDDNPLLVLIKTK
jgi:hypothetical protein